MNWREDSWFAHYHADKLTEKFKLWWLEFYGTPEHIENSYSAQHEYWVRCAFALMGWRARGEEKDENN